VADASGGGRDERPHGNRARPSCVGVGLPIATGGISRDGVDGVWATEPNVGRVAHGVPARVDRLHALGNAVVPQVAEYVGRRLMEVAA
jgi:hypothetical protein